VSGRKSLLSRVADDQASDAELSVLPDAGYLRSALDQVPRGADERDRARFAKFLSYMVLMDDKADCKNMRCRKRFDISGVKTMAFI
jgi:hypothetical protein